MSDRMTLAKVLLIITHPENYIVDDVLEACQRMMEELKVRDKVSKQWLSHVMKCVKYANRELLKDITDKQEPQRNRDTTSHETTTHSED